MDNRSYFMSVTTFHDHIPCLHTLGATWTIMLRHIDPNAWTISVTAMSSGVETTLRVWTPGTWAKHPFPFVVWPPQILRCQRNLARPGSIHRPSPCQQVPCQPTPHSCAGYLCSRVAEELVQFLVAENRSNGTAGIG
jgi:hypothetical protein